MSENKKNNPAITGSETLNDEQMEAVSGGETEIVISQPMSFKRCAADPSHVYPEVLDACPVCGCKKFTWM